MPYEKDLDKSLFAKSIDTETGRLTVSIFSYNNGPRKLQISRETKDNMDNLKFSKLGRMSKGEIESLLPIINEAMQQME